MKNIFNSIFILEKHFLLNKHKKQMCYKRNKYLYFDVVKNGQIFPSKDFNSIIFTTITEKWGTLEYTSRYVCKKIRFNSCLKNQESFGNSFSFPFSAKRFDRNFKSLL